MVAFTSLLETLLIKISAEPAFFAVIAPVFSTETTLESLEVYVNVLSVAFSGNTVGLIK